jgi:protein-disulfide isomerase
MGLRFRLPAAAMVALALTALMPLSQARADSFSPDQHKELERIIHDYLVSHPDVMLDVLQAAEAKIKSDSHDKAAQSLVEHKSELLNDPNSPVAGNPQGDVTLVEFFDYRCPYCKQVEPSLEALLGEDRKLRLVYKELPVLGPDSMVASRVALAARKQGKYDAFHRDMMALKGQINEAAIFKVAGSVGLDVERLKRDMNAPEIGRMLKDNTSLAEALQIRGTPGFVIGNEIIPGAVDLGTLKEMIADARQQK